MPDILRGIAIPMGYSINGLLHAKTLTPPSDHASCGTCGLIFVQKCWVP